MKLVPLLVLLLATSASAVPIISNGPANGFLYPFTSSNGPGSTIMGQEFIPTGAETVLDDFTLTISGGGPQTFRAYVQEWDTVLNQTTGPVLFESAVLTSVGAVTVSTGGLALSAGVHYLAYFTTLNTPGPFTEDEDLAYIFGATPTANLGYLRYATSVTSFDSTNGPGAASWNSSGNFGQFLFTANLSAAAPELDQSRATLPFAMLGLTLLAANRRRRVA